MISHGYEAANSLAALTFFRKFTIEITIYVD